VDVLDVLRLSEEKGGPERRAAITHLLKYARGAGCLFQPAGGKTGGFNVRYGSLGYSLVDVTTEGTVYFHVNPDSGRKLDEATRTERNDYIESLEGVTVKNGPIQNYGQVTENIEDIPSETMEKFIDYCVGHIRSTFYSGIH